LEAVAATQPLGGDGLQYRRETRAGSASYHS
jgi:hypothetical protein